MTSWQDIRRQAVRWYPDFLRAELSGAAFFPKPVRYAKLKPARIATRFDAIHQSLVELRQHSKEAQGHGYTVEWEEVNNRTIGRNRFPTAIYVADRPDYLSLLPPKLQTHYQQFATAVPRVRGQFPQLESWMLKHVKKVGDYGPVWPELLLVCDWFLHYHQRDRYYIRELPVAVPTKFVEQHKPVLSELLYQLLPAERIDESFVGNRDNNFEKRFGLKYDETLIRLRWLDPALADGVDDMAVQHTTFARHPFEGQHVVITENKMNFLTLPPLPRTLALWGGGFRVHLLREAQWLGTRKIHYWGDLDTHGLSILSQLRQFFPHVESLMMDQATFDQFYTHDQAPPIAQVSTDGLHEDERALFHRLKADNVRLEQEKIPQWYVNQQLEARIGDGG